MKKLVLIVLVIIPFFGFSQLTFNANVGLSSALGATQLAGKSVSSFGNLNLTYNVKQHYFLRLGYEHFNQVLDTAQFSYSSIPLDLGMRIGSKSVSTLLGVGYAYRFPTKTLNSTENKFNIGSLHATVEFHINSSPSSYAIIGLSNYLDLHTNSRFSEIKSRVTNLYIGLGVKLFDHKK